MGSPRGQLPANLEAMLHEISEKHSIGSKRSKRSAKPGVEVDWNHGVAISAKKSKVPFRKEKVLAVQESSTTISIVDSNNPGYDCHCGQFP